MATWGEYRDMVRLVYLRDLAVPDPDPGADPVLERYSDAMMLHALGLAQNALCPHTAYEKVAVYESPTYTLATALQFPTPDDAFFKVVDAGLVYFTRPNDLERYYIRPLDLKQKTDRGSNGYYQWPSQYITLTTNLPADANKLCVQYYASYPLPANDNAVLTFPKWAEAAIAYMLNHYVLIQQATSETNIAQYKASPDKGGPEDGAMRRQMDYLYRQFQRELLGFPQQRKMTHQLEYYDL